MYKKIAIATYFLFLSNFFFASDQNDRAENVIALMQQLYMHPEDQDLENYIINTCQESMGRDQGQIYIDYQDEGGSTFLHHAILLQSPRILATLLDLGANANLQDIKNSTPLHVAVDTNNLPAVQLLLTYPDINIFVEDESGDTPLDKARKSRLDDIEYFLIQKEDEILNQSGVTDVIN
ncbi:MAG: ankyrin repeat domain-containing protein [Candidatus Chromulinivorax sp.]